MGWNHFFPLDWRVGFVQFMAEIRLTTWDVKNLASSWDKLPTSTGAGFLPSTVFHQVQNF